MKASGPHTRPEVQPVLCPCHNAMPRCREGSPLNQCQVIGALLKFSDAEQQELSRLVGQLRLHRGGLLRRISQLPGRLLRPEGASPRAAVGPDGKISITSNWVTFLTEDQEQSAPNGIAPAQPLDDTPRKDVAHPQTCSDR
jgi:hypothetical protein